MRPRKLLPEPILAKASELAELGVPVAKIIRDMELDISSPALSNLIRWYDKRNPAIHLSLFPNWLDTNKVAQSGWKYHGYFTIGQWMHE